jgi:hypothetical protein
MDEGLRGYVSSWMGPMVRLNCLPDVPDGPLSEAIAAPVTHLRLQR